MGKRWVQHSSMCGCERCARECERDNPQPVFDAVEDPEYREDGTHISEPPSFWDDEYDDGP